MLLKVPFLFSAQVRLARTRSAKMMDSLLGSVHVMFAETTKEQAPIVLWMTTPNVTNTLQTAVRWHDDALWHPFLMNNVGGEARSDTAGFFRETGLPFNNHAPHSYTEKDPSLFTPESFSAYVAAGLGPSSISGISQVFASPNGAVGEGVDIGCLNIKEIDFSEQEALKAQIARFATDIILVDGVPHRRVRQPTIAFTYFQDFQVDFSFGDVTGESMPEQIRQIDRFEDAIEALERLNVKPKDNCLAPPEIVRPDLLKLDDDLGPATRAVVASALMHGVIGYGVGESRISGYVPEVAKAFLSLRDSYLDSASTHVLMTRLETLVASLPAETPDDDGFRDAGDRLAVLKARAGIPDILQRIAP